MAQITSKFNVGDKVYTFDKTTFKMKVIVVAQISVYIRKDTQKTSVFADDANGNIEWQNSYDEELCFASEDELLEYVKSVA